MGEVEELAWEQYRIDWHHWGEISARFGFVLSHLYSASAESAADHQPKGGRCQSSTLSDVQGALRIEMQEQNEREGEIAQTGSVAQNS